MKIQLIDDFTDGYKGFMDRFDMKYPKVGLMYTIRKTLKGSRYENLDEDYVLLNEIHNNIAGPFIREQGFPLSMFEEVNDKDIEKLMT